MKEKKKFKHCLVGKNKIQYIKGFVTVSDTIFMMPDNGEYAKTIYTGTQMLAANSLKLLLLHAMDKIP